MRLEIMNTQQSWFININEEIKEGWIENSFCFDKDEYQNLGGINIIHSSDIFCFLQTQTVYPVYIPKSSEIQYNNKGYYVTNRLFLFDEKLDLNSFEVVKYLINNGALISPSIPGSLYDGHALDYFTINGQIEALDYSLVIEKNAMKRIDELLLLAIKFEQHQMIQYLKGRGAKLETKN